MRVSIIGNSGSGKSTLARQLAHDSGAPILDLDTVAWEPGQIAVPRAREAAVADVRAFCAAGEQWVVEGCYAHLIQATFEHQPVLLFLEPGRERCLENGRARPWEAHKYPSKAEQDARLEFLLEWVAAYYTRDGDMSLEGHEALFRAYAGPKQRLAGLPASEFALDLGEET